MAKPKYPLMCATARGILGGRLVYREIGGIPVVSIFRPAIDRKTPAQLASRQKFRDIATAWNTHTQEEKDTLQPFVDGKNLTIYDYYTKKFIETGEDPLGPPPGPSTTPIIYTDLLSAHIIEPRATQPFGYQYIFLAPEGQFFGLVRDNENSYYDNPIPPTTNILAFVVMTINEGVNITAGDRLEVSTDVGDYTIYMPEYIDGLLFLFVADDGSTYYDYPLSTLAYAAPQ